MKTLKIDFTGKHAGKLVGELQGFKSFKELDEKLIALLRAKEAKTLVILDPGYALPEKEPYLVSDHLNFTGTSPLTGPNHPCGERFPVVNDIYLTEFAPEAKKGVVAGIKKGVTPDAQELDLMKKLGAGFYSYNLVPTMLVAAHAGWKVIGIVVPEDGSGETKIAKLLSQYPTD